MKIVSMEFEDKSIFSKVDDAFKEYALENEVYSDYKPFSYVAKENNQVLGVITGKTSYDEVHIRDLLVFKEARFKGIGMALMNHVINIYKNMGYRYITLTTYQFQAPKFYEKCGFQIEFVRENQENSKLTKYFFIKYLKGLLNN